MTEIRQQAAIRPRIYIAGVNCLRDPLPVISKKRAESKVTTSNLAMHVDRLFVSAGLPNIPERHEFTMSWKDLREAGLLEHVDRLASIGQPFDVAIWKQVYDIFDGDGSTKTFYLQRRQAVDYNLPAGVPTVSFPDFETRLTVLSDPYKTDGGTETELAVIHKNSTDIDTGDPASTGDAWVEDDGHLLGNRLVSKVRLHDAPDDKHDILVAAYMPLYKMVIDQETPRSYGEALVEPRGYRFVEVG